MKNKLTLITVLLAGSCSLALAEDCQVPQQKSNSAKTEALAAELSKTNACKMVRGLTAKSLKTVWLALLDTKATGGKRFETPPPAGIPTGKVYPVDGRLVFDLREIPAGEYIGLKVMAENNRELSFNPGTSGKAAIILQNLKPGSSYSWVLLTKNQTYRGEFNIPEQDDLNDLKDRLSELDQQAITPDIKRIYQAAIFDDADCDFNRDELLGQIREHKN